jgi:Fur family peroxide stress response transcriptional regulator
MYFIKIRKILKSSSLKITPQRVAVLEAFENLAKHPTADKIIDYIRGNHPNIAIGTVYKTLETFVDKGILIKVKTEKDVMRYDHIVEPHHHLYCVESDRIEDYFDDELNVLLTNYFNKKQIPDFEVDDIKLQIKGKFNNK